MTAEDLITVLLDGVDVLERVPSSLERVGLRTALEQAVEHLQAETERADRAEEALSRIDELAAEVLPEDGTPPSSCSTEHLARVSESAAAATRGIELPHRALVAIWYLATAGSRRIETDPSEALDACASEPGDALETCARCARFVLVKHLHRIAGVTVCRDLVGCMRSKGCDCDPQAGFSADYVEHEDHCSLVGGAPREDEA